MGKISFHSHTIKFAVSHPRKTAKWIRLMVAQEGKELSKLTYIFCADSFLMDLNKQYLKHNTDTDIISFDLSEDSSMEGEIYISIPRVRENAKRFDAPFEEELRRNLIHGVLHLMGYSDKTEAQRAVMRKKEQACLSLY